METTLTTFKIKGTFEEWSVIFDSDEARKRHREFDITPIFRGVNKEDRQSVVVIHEHPIGALEKFITSNKDWISTHNVDLTSFKTTIWTKN